MYKILVLPLFLAGVAGAQSPCKTLSPDAQDALLASPANHTVLYENADVRVLDVHSQPRTREAVHTHRLPSVMYILRQGAGTYDTPDGSDHRSHPTDPNFKPRIIAIKADEGPHWTENTGDVPFHAIRVEFKHPGCGLAGWKASAPGPEDALATAAGSHTLLLENADVRVLDIHLPPHGKDAMPSYPWPGFVYVAQAATVSYRTPSTTGSEPRKLAGGAIVPMDTGTYAIENIGDTPLHLIRFELKYGLPPSK